MPGHESDLAPATEQQSPAPSAPVPGAGIPAGGPARPMRAFQASIGNAAVARRILREGSDSSGGVAPPVPGSTAPADQSSAGGPARTGPPDFKKLVAEKDTSGIREVKDFTGAEPADRIAMIHCLLEDTLWVGGSDRATICQIWEAWGPKGIVEAYAQNEALWDACVDKEAKLAGLEALRPYRERFGSDVKAVAGVYQEKNAAAVKAEMERLNTGHVDDLLGAGGEAPIPGDEIAEVQQIAREVQRADDLLTGLYAIPVGAVMMDAAPKAPGAPGGDRSTAGGSEGSGPAPAPTGGDSAGGPGAAPAAPGPVAVSELFSPNNPPKGSIPAGRESEFRAYEDVMSQFRRVTAARAILASRSPALFAAANGKPGEAGRIAAMSPREAQTVLGRVLNATKEAIERAGPMIASDKIDWRDFTPIHQQLYDGMPARSGLAWNSKLAKSVAKDVIGDYKATEFWRTLELAGIAGAAFLFSEIATAGMATFLWAAAGTAAGGVQAGLSVEKYETLAAAAKTATSKDTQLVTTDQVSEAQAAAVLDTAFAFLDVFMAAKGALGGAKAAASASRLTARKGLEGFAALSGDAARADVLRTALRELGPQETIRSSGVSVDELVRLVGGETTQEGKALRLAEVDASVAKPRGAGIDNLPAGVPSAVGRKFASRAHAEVYEKWAELGTANKRLSKMVEILNEELDRIGAPRVGSIPNDKVMLAGELNPAGWRVDIQPSLLGGAKPSEGEFEVLWGLVSHEVDHGSQWFNVAQVKSAAGKTPAQIASELGIPEAVAKRAEAVQAGRTSKPRLMPGTDEWKAAEVFEESLVGKGSPHREKTLDELDAARKELTAAEAELAKHKNVPITDPKHKAALERLEKASSAYDTVEIAYVQLPEEAAAYRTGASAQASMAERFALVRELESAKAAKSSGISAMKRIEGEMGVLAEAGKDVPYKLTVDFYQEDARVAEAVSAIEEATANLAKADRGVAP